MPAIHLDHLSFSYSSAVEVFTEVSVHLGTGWTGVVDPNGAGKSTLLSLIAGELPPTAGQVVLDPAGSAVFRCRQEVDTPTPGIEAFADATDGTSRKWLGRLRIDPAGLDRWHALSPGERKRWQLGAALASDPNILLLDEPTNHLDPGARGTVEAALARFDGVGLVISHDRGLLDRLTSGTLQVEHSALRLWSAPYSVALEAWTAEEAAAWERHAAVRRQEKALRRRLADERRAADQRDARFKRQTRKAAPKDHDARSMAAKGRHESGSVAGQRRRTVIRGALERTETAAAAALKKDLGASIFFDYEPSPRRLHLPQELTREEGVQLLMSGRPSPGEARKLAMALGLGVGAWGMILDEPTNHLDLPAVERIESALDAYPGALVMVTHDETFAVRTTTTTWELDSGVLTVSASRERPD